MRHLPLIIVVVLLPGVSEAAVTVSEVAWMGNSTSANNEWIELHNDGGSSVDVTDWTLSDGKNLTITLAGVIGAGQYVVLERTSDDSAPGAAFLTYTGALVNTGATLSIRTAAGGIEDQVAGGEDWENIGGDNTTKETAQYSGSGWITANATPGRVNATVGSAPATEDTDDKADSAKEDSISSQSSDSPSSNIKTAPLVLPDITLELALTVPERGYVNQAVAFTMESSGIGAHLDRSLKYRWNFGDGGTSGGKNPTHVYQYPGTYVVMVEASYARQKAVTRKKITILPVMFSLTHNRAGDVQINNNAKYEIDLSGYQLLASESVTLPKNTILLPNATLTIPKEELGNERTLVVLADPEGGMVAETGVAAPTDAAVPNTAPPAAPIATAPASQFQFQSEDAALAPAPEDNQATVSVAEAVGTPPTQEAAVAQTGGGLPKSSWPYLGFMGVAALGIVGVFAGRSKSRQQLEE